MHLTHSAIKLPEASAVWVQLAFNSVADKRYMPEIQYNFAREKLMTQTSPFEHNHCQ